MQREYSTRLSEIFAFYFQKVYPKILTRVQTESKALRMDKWVRGCAPTLVAQPFSGTLKPVWDWLNIPACD